MREATDVAGMFIDLDGIGIEGIVTAKTRTILLKRDEGELAAIGQANLPIAEVG